MEKLEKVKELLSKYGQEHLLVCYEKLSNDDKEKLLDQILSIDFELMNQLYENTKKEIDMGNDVISPIGYVDKSKITENEYSEIDAIGTKAIKAGKLAALTMAGGQGTRLGYDGPKGTFDLGLPSHKTLFEILCDTLKVASKKYGVDIPWYIMTSNENNKQTVEFFEKHNYLGYPKDCIKFFIQGELPMIGTDGKILVNEDGLIKLAADGHGGVFESMTKSGVLEDMKKRNVEWIFIGGVDNTLVHMVDPILVGLAEKNKCTAAGKSVVKDRPEEKVGVFCTRNGKPSVVEYTEITEEMANMTDENGELVYGESHILCNLFNIERINDIAKHKLPYHSAFKKAKYIDENGELVEPSEPNAYKFEAFIFDAFTSLDSMAVLRVKREEEFAPVKNAEGNDSPATSRELYKKFHGIREVEDEGR